MKTFTQISISLALTLGLGSVALAGDAKTPAPAPTTPAKKEATPAAKMEPMKAPQEITDLGKMMVGNWKCTGKVAMDPKDMTKMVDMKLTMKMKMDLGGWWMVGNLDSPMFKGVMYVTYDPASKKWHSMSMDSMGGSQTATSMGMKDNKIVWEGDMRSPMPGMAAAKVRETHDLSDMKAGAKMTGEMSMDGKTWMKGWESTCKK